MSSGNASDTCKAIQRPSTYQVFQIHVHIALNLDVHILIVLVTILKTIINSAFQ